MRRNIEATLCLAVLLLAGAAATAEQREDDATPAVLVTGASSGIGLRITERLAAAGTFVYAGARDAEDIERLDAMDNVEALRLDVTVQQDIDAAVQRVRDGGRGLYGLVNNAGVASIGPLIEVEEDDVKFVFDVNVLGPYRITRAFAPMIIDSAGRIVNISSISGVLSGELFGVYSMSKHAVEAFTDSLASELARFDVEVIAVEPGNYSSNIGRNMLERMQARGYDIKSSRWSDSLQRMLDGFADYDEPGEYNPEPDDVAIAVESALFDSEPRPHYMVVPYPRQAEVTIRKVIEELVSYNQGQRYSFSRDELVRMLDEAL